MLYFMGIAGKWGIRGFSYMRWQVGGKCSPAGAGGRFARFSFNNNQSTTGVVWKLVRYFRARLPLVLGEGIREIIRMTGAGVHRGRKGAGEIEREKYL
jgi:hypothetical protein